MNSLFKKIGATALTLGLIGTASTDVFAASTEVIPNETIINVGNTENIMTPFAAGWQMIGGGSTDWSFKKGSSGTLSHVSSAGGDFRITFMSGRGSFTFDLMEYDPGSNADEVVRKGIKITSDNTITFRDISKFKDGDNDKAEFYIKYYDTKTSGSYRVFYYD